MAGAGEFPKIDGDIIYQADYNAIQSVIAGVVSTYYGNSISSGQITGNPQITALALQQLKADIIKAYRHITGDLYNPGFVPNASEVVDNAHFNSLKDYADFCETNKNTVALGFGQLDSAVESSSITSAWNGNRVFLQSYIWPSEAVANYWFNAGGFFLVDVSGSNSSGSSKDNDWQNNILNAIPTQTYTNTQWDAGTNIDVYEYGNVSQYVENYCRIQIIKNSTTMLTVAVLLSDADAGDQTGIGAAVDEDVNTDATAAITRYYSVDAITVTNPSITTNSTF